VRRYGFSGSSFAHLNSHVLIMSRVVRCLLGCAGP
jgi:hypothetical protein